MPETVTKTRRQRFEELCEEHDMSLTDFELDEYVGQGDDENDLARYAAFEISLGVMGRDYSPWAYIADTLNELEDDLNNSDTERESVVVYDLNTGEEFGCRMVAQIDRPDGFGYLD